MEMSERIKERRVLMGYTQEELGKKLGLQKSAIAKYENGRVENIKRGVIANMAKVLDCSPTYLMGWDDNPGTASPASKPLILDYYEMLNDIGKHEATKRVMELTEVPRYAKENINYEINAAHADDYANAPEELKQLEEDIMDDENF